MASMSELGITADVKGCQFYKAAGGGAGEQHARSMEDVLGVAERIQQMHAEARAADAGALGVCEACGQEPATCECEECGKKLCDTYGTVDLGTRRTLCETCYEKEWSFPNA